jgi:hypothetical protein
MAIKTYHRGIRGMVIAPWVDEDDFGAFYQVKGARNMSLEWVVETDQLIGDDVVLDRYTKIVSVTVRMEQAAVDLAIVDYILGGTLVSNAAYEDFMISESEEVPYLAIAGRVVGSGGGSDLHILVPKAKLSGNLALSATQGAYMLPTAEFQGVNEGDINGMARLRKFFGPTAVEIPLRTTIGFA